MSHFEILLAQERERMRDFAEDLEPELAKFKAMTAKVDSLDALCVAATLCGLAQACFKYYLHTKTYAQLNNIRDLVADEGKRSRLDE